MPKKGNEKIAASIYQVDLSLFNDDAFDAVIQRILKAVAKKGDKYYPATLSATEFEGFRIEVYFKRRTGPPRWLGFLGKILSEGSELSQAINVGHDFLLFAQLNKYIFAITGGAGSSAIDIFTSQFFGMGILARLIEKNSPVIRQIQERGVTGVVLGQTRFYRDDQRLSDEQAFGVIYKQVKAELDKKILKAFFGFKEAELKKDAAGCLAKSSFQINKLVDFPVFLRLLRKLGELWDQEPNFTLNNVELITGKTETIKRLKEDLKDALIAKLYGHFKDGTYPDFDCCHKDFEKYLSARYYFIPEDDKPHFNGAPTLAKVFEVAKKMKGTHVTDIYYFKHFILQETYIQTKDEEGVTLTMEPVFDHIHGEVSLQGKSYFFIDGMWYRINPAFVEELNKQCKQLVADAWDDALLTKPFTYASETRYNESFIGEPDTLVFDTITPEKIEGCDILKYDQESVYLIHVKQGFDNSIRDLAGQVGIAARRIAQDRLSGYQYIQDIEAKTKRGKFSASGHRQALAGQAFPAGGLETLFQQKREKNICFCLAFVDTAVSQRSLRDQIELFDSNIAKYALVELKQAVRRHNFDFKVIQIPKA